MFNAIQRFQSFKLRSVGALMFAGAYLLLGGCSGLRPSQAPQLPPSVSEYQSEVSDSEAKAMYAYGQFRLYAAEERWHDALAALERAALFDPDSLYLKLMLAKTYLFQKMTGDAAIVLDEMIEKDPTHIEALQLRGDLASFEKDFKGAKKYYRQALTHGAKDHDINLRLAIVLSRLNEKKQAAEILETFLEDAPDSEVARLALARIYNDLGLTVRAQIEFTEILKQNPNQIQAALGYGVILEAIDPENALTFYLDFLRNNPQATMIMQRLVEYYIAREQFEAALSQLQEIRWEHPENTRVSGQIGLLQLELKNWTSAEKEFRLLLSHGDQLDRNHYYLALALIGQGEEDGAVNELKAVAASSEFYKLARLQLAYLYNERGDIEKALAALTENRDASSYDTDTFYFIIALLGDNQRLGDALTYAQKAIDAYPEEARLWYQLGVLYERMGNHDKALQTMEQVLTVDENHADALNFLAYQMAVSGQDLNLALLRAKRALQNKNSGYIIDTLGWVYYKLERYDESRIQLEEAARLHPDDPVITEHLGDLYVAMELWDKAVMVYRRVLALDNDALGVAEKLRQAENRK